MRDRLQRGVRQVADFCIGAARGGSDRGKKTLVQVITDDKIIQAGMTSAFVGIIMALSEGTGISIKVTFEQVVPVRIPGKFYTAGVLVFVFYFWFWATQNEEKFRRLVEEATGEEATESDVSDDG